MFEIERTKQEVKKAIPLKIERNPNLRLLVAKSSSAKMLPNFSRTRGNGEKNFMVQALYL
jgi:hypothetical protein